MNLSWADEAIAAFDHWLERVYTHGNADVAESSPLQRDNRLPNGQLPCTLAWRALAAGCEELAVISEYLRLTDMTVMAKAFAVLGRAGLLGAAKAVYLLEPEVPADRYWRAMRLYNSELEAMEKLLEDDDGGELDELAVHLAKMRSACKEAFSEAGIPKADRWISETRLLAQVSTVLDGERFSALPAMMNTWRYTSGVAHNLSWHWDLLPQRDVRVDQQLDVTILVPFRLTEQAWNLWDRRRAA